MKALFIERTKKRFNYAILYILSYLLNKNVNFRLLIDPSYEKFEKEIKSFNPEFIFLSLKWFDQVSDVLEDTKFIKKISPFCKVVIGGITSNLFSKDLIKLPEIDIIIRGDAEKPIYNLLNGKEELNLITKKGTSKKLWFQNEADLEEAYLIDDKRIGIDIIKDNNFAFIWFGKGCSQNCFYCGGNKFTQRECSGRNKVIYRSKEKIINDLKICCKYSGVIFFDFEPENKATEFQIELFKKSPSFDAIIYNALWTLPPNYELLRVMSKKFSSNYILIDLVSFSERIRYLLSKKGFIKNTCSNKELVSFLNKASSLKNVKIHFDAIVGLPFETRKDIFDSIKFWDYLMDRFPNLIDSAYEGVHPLHNQPGSDLFKKNKKYNFKSDFNQSEAFDRLVNKFDFFDKKNIKYPFDYNLSKEEFLKYNPYGGSVSNISPIEVKCRCLLLNILARIKRLEFKRQLEELINYAQSESYGNVKLKVQSENKLLINFYGNDFYDMQLNLFKEFPKLSHYLFSKNYSYRRTKSEIILYNKNDEKRIELNKIGKQIFDLMIQDFPRNKIIKNITKKYSIEEQEIKEDVQNFLHELNMHKIIKKR